VTDHSRRKHAKLSASGAERWVNCPGSVALSEGIPDKSSPASEEGTRAHEVLETILRHAIGGEPTSQVSNVSREMWQHAADSARHILRVWRSCTGADLLIEQHASLAFIDESLWGTYDAAVIELFGTLHVLDFKYGTFAVSPQNNLQMIFYALGVAHRFDWNFQRARLWILQPRVCDGAPVFWELSISELREYVQLFREAVERTRTQRNHFKEGSYCYFCKAKAICPVQRERKIAQGKLLFAPVKS
jgi:hypothetical protein